MPPSSRPAPPVQQAASPSPPARASLVLRDMPFDDRRVAAVRVGLGLALGALVTCLILTTCQLAAGDFQPATGILALIVIAALTATCLLLLSRPGLELVVVAAVLALAVATPWISGLVHQQAAPLVSAAGGATVAAITLACRHVNIVLMRSAVLTLISGLVTASFLVGIAVQSSPTGTVFGSSVRVFYLTNDREWSGLWQLEGFLGHPNTLAVITCLALAFQAQALVANWRRNVWWERVGWIVLVTVSVLTLLWTQSRTGWAAAFVGMVALGLPVWRDRRGLITTTFVTCLLAVPVLPLILAKFGMSFHGRDFAWNIAQTEVATSPLVGAGPQVFGLQYWQDMAALGPFPWEPRHGHNQLVQAALIFGAVGLLIVVAAFIMIAAVAVASRFVDGRWAMATFGVIAVFSGVEPTLGIDEIWATYLPAFIAALVVGTAVNMRSPVAIVAQSKPLDSPQTPPTRLGTGNNLPHGYSD